MGEVPRTRDMTVRLTDYPSRLLTAPSKWHPDAEQTGCHSDMALGDGHVGGVSVGQLHNGTSAKMVSSRRGRCC
jgi:hypothetical protein